MTDAPSGSSPKHAFKSNRKPGTRNQVPEPVVVVGIYMSLNAAASLGSQVSGTRDHHPHHMA